MNTTVINIENATKSFKGVDIFKNINLKIERNKSYGFIGHNGCGKSVLFKCICGFYHLDSGKIIYNEKQINKDVDFIYDTGVVIEDPKFINDLSGYKNLKMIVEIQNKIGDKEIFETMKLFDLYNDKDKKVRAYSLGMKQKLRLCQAFMESPDLIILDEPTNCLDKTSISLLHNVLKNFIKSGGTLLMTSHNQNDIKECCEIVYEFDNCNLSQIN